MKNFGKNNLIYTVLDNKRIEILDKLSIFKNNFYLAGETGLALQLGHRKSVDFDFFTAIEFNNQKLIDIVKETFYGAKISVIQNELDTLTFLLDDSIKISLFKLQYANFLPLVKTEFFNLAQIPEIGVMKLLELFRATYKDYVDVYFILQKYELAEIIDLAVKKHSEFDVGIYLRALLAYDDVDDFPISFMPNFEVDRKAVFSFIEKTAVEYLKIDK